MEAAAFAEMLSGPLADLPDPLALEPLPRDAPPPRVNVRPPGSKSLTNRALLLAALAEGRSEIRGALIDADDARRMLDALRTLGVGVDTRSDGRVIIDGGGGGLPGGGAVGLGNAGTATRFLTAAACLAGAPVEIDGDPRMRERPIGELIALLRTLGVEIEERGEPGRVPLRIAPRRPRGGALDVGATLSSQYVSALLMIGPWLEDGIELRFAERPTSPSYVEMTVSLLERLGARVRAGGEGATRVIAVEPGPLRGFELEIEPDASGATYFWGAGAIIPGSMVTVEGVGDGAVQGDAGFVELLARMGATVLRRGDSTTVAGQDRLRGIEADLSSMPDAAMTLAAVACFATGPTTMRGLRTLRVKETDRIEAMRAELAKLGVEARPFEESGDEGLEIFPPEEGLDCRLYAPSAEIETYDDHRMAMSMAIPGLRRPVMRVRDPGCVAKTYPTFWRDWARLYGRGVDDA